MEPPPINHNKDEDISTPLLDGLASSLNQYNPASDATLDYALDAPCPKLPKQDLHQATVDAATATSSNALGPTHALPPSTLPKDAPAPSDDQNTCRICGEGEDEEEDYSDDYDEESLISICAPPNGSPETTPFIPRPHSNNSSAYHRHSKKWIQQKNPLIRPCRCKGTMMYVHVSCLNRWRNMSPRASSYVACDLCGYQYNIYRPRYAAIVTNVHFLRLMTAFLVLLSIGVCAYLCKLVDVYLLGHLPDPDNKEWLDLHGATWLWMDRFYLFAGLVVISMLGMVYLTFLCVARPLDQNASSAGGLLCCDQTSCPWYSCYLADVAACSGDAAAGGFLVFLVLMSLLAILFGILGAVTGVYRWMEAFVDRIAGHVKERILDVD
ncbi:hypothetical protein [Absidia glauca]|uniref:RING-CH-type domain-containing protein n=1 Tax=Absidia glauca TaxID=4829 RepID=A0A163K8Z9_ABSGL|nr:hypothetical protein [Absidia glauca]